MENIGIHIIFAASTLNIRLSIQILWWLWSYAAVSDARWTFRFKLNLLFHGECVAAVPMQFFLSHQNLYVRVRIGIPLYSRCTTFRSLYTVARYIVARSRYNHIPNKHTDTHFNTWFLLASGKNINKMPPDILVRNSRCSVSFFYKFC